MQHIVHFALQKQRIITTVGIFSCENNSFLINDASLFKIAAFNVALLDTAWIWTILKLHYLIYHYFYFQKQSPRGVLRKKVFLEISQNSQENTWARVSFLIKLQAGACNFIKKKRLGHMCFPKNFAKFLRTLFSQNTSRRLLLYFKLFHVEHFIQYCIWWTIFMLQNLMLHYAVLILHCLMLHYLLHYVNVLLFVVAVVVVALATVTLFNVALF